MTENLICADRSCNNLKHNHSWMRVEAKKVQFYTKNVFGNTLIYLVDSNEAQNILNLIGQKIINKFQMRRFSELGIVFEQIINPEEKL